MSRPAGGGDPAGPPAGLTVGLLAGLWMTANTQRLTAASFVGASSIMADFGITAALAGLLVSAYFPAYGLLQVPVGLLADRVAPRATLLVALALLAASNVLFALAPSIEWAIAARVLVGLSSAPVFLSCLKICSTLSLPLYPRRVGLLVTAGSVGTLIGLSGLPVLLALLPWRTVGLLLAVPLLAVLVPLALARLPGPPPGERRTVGDLLAGLGEQLCSARFWWLALPATTWCGAQFGVLGWLPRFARDVLQVGPSYTGALPGLFSAGLLVGGSLAGAAQSRRRRLGPWLFFGGGTLFCAAVVLLPFLQPLGLGGLLYLLTPCMGLLFGGFFTWFGLLSELVPPARLGTITGVLNGLTFLPSFADPWLFGILLDLVDRPAAANPAYSVQAYTVGFLVMAGSMALGLLGGLLCGRRRAGRPRSALLEAS